MLLITEERRDVIWEEVEVRGSRGDETKDGEVVLGWCSTTDKGLDL